MKLVILANQTLKEEVLSNGVQPEAELVWVSNLHEFLNHPDPYAFIDLLFENTKERLRLLNQLMPALVIVNSVAHTLQEKHPLFIRINAWNTFLKSTLIEAAAAEQQRQKADAVLSQFHKSIEWLPDEPGFVTPRVVSMIVNEAFMALQEGVSSKEEINTAMKLGTNYPFGPFEWAEKIGLANIASLLEKLSPINSRYTPSALLLQTTV